jgi:hypothetical protein
VNNEGICKEDPFAELQDIINNKSKKYKKYTENTEKCDECTLLDCF